MVYEHLEAHWNKSTSCPMDFYYILLLRSYLRKTRFSDYTAIKCQKIHKIQSLIVRYVLAVQNSNFTVLLIIEWGKFSNYNLGNMELYFYFLSS